MKMLRVICAAALGAPLAWLAVPAAGANGQLSMLDNLEAGSWSLRPRGGSVDGEQRICISSGRDLIQLRHRGLSCKQVVVLDKPNEVTVQYTCPGNGYGRTNIRRETDGLIQIDTQGIRHGQPFAYAAEGRRVGACAR